MDEEASSEDVFPEEASERLSERCLLRALAT